MKVIVILSIIFTFVFLESSCGISTNKESKTYKLKIAAASSSNNKNSYVEELKSKLDDWNNGIIKLEGKADKFKGNMKSDYEKELSILHSQRDEIMQKLDEIQNSADNSWENIKQDLENSGINLQKAVSNALVRFK